MVKKAKAAAGLNAPAEDSDEVRSLAAILTKQAQFKLFSVWLIGDTPLIVHAWSEKARREMLVKQIGAPKAGKEKRDPEQDFQSSLYEMGDGTYGFPITGVKKAMLEVAHKDKGLAKTSLKAALWLDADIVRVRPALAGAVCDMPLVRVYGSEPVMREDMVKIGAGMKKIANLSYRAQFTNWAIKVTGRFNSTQVNEEQLAFLISEAGMACGLGEWRNEREGIFGAFHLGSLAEEKAWEDFAAGKGPLPAKAVAQSTVSLAKAAE